MNDDIEMDAEVKEPKKVDRWEAAQKKIDSLQEKAVAFAGKDGFNPYFWIKRTLDPISKRLASGERNDAFFSEIKALKLTEADIKAPQFKQIG